MAGPVRIAVVGEGVIGRRHAGCVVADRGAELVGIADRSAAGREVAAAHGVRWFADLPALLREDRPEAVVIATPNQVHVEHGMQAVEAGVAALVEKPLADDAGEAARLVEAAEAAGVPLLTGHHRRHVRTARTAREVIQSGRLGWIVAVHGHCWLRKADDYFAVPWRREAGAGPVLINLVHDVDLLRYFCGEVDEVQAMDSNAARGHAVEDTAAVLLRFASGAVGTMTVSDAAVSPWSWECTSGEDPAYDRTGQACYTVAGTAGALAVPSMAMWTHAGGGEAHWMRPFSCETLRDDDGEDPLAAQIRNLCGVVRGTEAPVASGREGLRTMRVVAAIKEAAATRLAVRVG